MVQQKIHECEDHFKAIFKHVEDLAKAHNVSNLLFVHRWAKGMGWGGGRPDMG